MTKKMYWMMGLLFALIAIPTWAQNGTKLEAEAANYANCKVITDGKYSGGKALELTDQNAQITFVVNTSAKGNTLPLNVLPLKLFFSKGFVDVALLFKRTLLILEFDIELISI